MEEGFIGVDLGTSSCKVVLTDRSGKIVAYHKTSYGVSIGEGGKAEQSPTIWFDAVKKGISMVARAASGSYSVKAIGLTGQWSGTVPVGDDGRELADAIIWMDTRGRKYVRELTSGFPSLSGYRVDKLYKWLRKTAGAPAHSGKDSLAHILFIKNEFPQLYESTYKFLEPKDYIAMKLTGEFKASWDNIALLWLTDNRNPNRIKYDDELIRMAKVDRDKLPELVSPLDTVGALQSAIASELGLQDGVQVISGSGDMQCSLIGSGCVSAGSLLLYAGTSAWITTHITQKKTDIFHNMASLPSSLPGLYFVAAEQENAGNCLEFISNIMGLSGDEKYENIDRMVSSAKPASGNLIFLPWLFGERTPVEDPYVRGGFYNLSLEHRREDLFRAVMEGVAYNARWLLASVERFISSSTSARPQLVMSGGVALSNVWPQIFSDILEREISVVKAPNLSTARGAALLSALGMKSINSDEITSDVARVYLPDSKLTDIYRRGFSHFVSYYWRNRKDMKKLNSYSGNL
ncbi:MAG: FGGY-family carbohydrate kinase [Conexivisphaerales archaeon]